MAEALAAIGVIANIMQLIDYSLKATSRIDEYGHRTTELPETLEHVRLRLGPLSDALRKLELGIKSGAVEKASRGHLWEAIQGCEKHIKQLTEIIKKCVPEPNASRAQRTMKALGSLRYDKKIEKIDAELGKYIQGLAFHTTASQAYDGVKGPFDAPNPTSTVPFRPDPYYVERPILMSQIEDMIDKPASRVALVGIGGVGKSQLAIQYAHQLRTNEPNTWVFWLSADSTANFDKGLAEIAEKADIAAYYEGNKDKFLTVKRWLEDEKNGKWLIVIDNADDLSILVPGPPVHTKKKSKNAELNHRPTQNILDLLPQTTNGSYLVTSRDREVAYQITGDYKSIIPVSVFSETEAIDLLHKRLTEAPEDSDAKALLKALDYVPLAISHAAAYIERGRPRMTVPKYIEKLRKGTGTAPTP